MVAVRSQFVRDDLAGDLQALHAAIAAAVPLAAGGRNQRILDSARPRVAELETLAGVEQAEPISSKWREQLGTLGSGNHFIEVSLDEDDSVWLFLHSGSRGVGNRLAQKHIAVAQRQCAQRFIPLPDRDLAYLVEGEPQFDAYLEALLWAQRYAYLNREKMMDRVVDCLSSFVGVPVQRLEQVNCHHNYTSRERHFGRDL